ADESGWSGSYTVERGDSLYEIARKHGVRLNELERVNNITNPRRVMPGTVLKVPQPGDAQRVASAPARPSAPVAPAATESAGPPSVQPTIINARTRVASLGKDTADGAPARSPAAASERPVRDAAVAAPKASEPAAKFRWPARGKIIASFGPQSGGNNDGINIALPRGADVFAAEAGVVT